MKKVSNYKIKIEKKKKKFIYNIYNFKFVLEIKKKKSYKKKNTKRSKLN